MQIKTAYNCQDVRAAVAELAAEGWEVYPTGSAYFNDHGADIDIIIVGRACTPSALVRLGYEPCAVAEYPGDRCWIGRKGPINVICTLDTETAEAWVRATLAVARLADLGLHLPKAGRCAVFESIIDSVDPYLELRELYTRIKGEASV